MLSHFEESEAQERYILGMGTNEQQQRRDLNPATLTVQLRGYLKIVHCSSTAILKSLPQPTSMPSSHNHSALWSSPFFDFQRLMQNQRSILELSVSPDSQNGIVVSRKQSPAWLADRNAQTCWSKPQWKDQTSFVL